MRPERRHPCLHECEARKGSRDLRPAKFHAAEKRDVAGKDACVPVASAFSTPQIPKNHEQRTTNNEPQTIAANTRLVPACHRRHRTAVRRIRSCFGVDTRLHSTAGTRQRHLFLRHRNRRSPASRPPRRTGIVRIPQSTAADTRRRRGAPRSRSYRLRRNHPARVDRSRCRNRRRQIHRRSFVIRTRLRSTDARPRCRLFRRRRNPPGPACHRRGRTA